MAPITTDKANKPHGDLRKDARQNSGHQSTAKTPQE
jgi:hypothetical protein